MNLFPIKLYILIFYHHDILLWDLFKSCFLIIAIRVLPMKCIGVDIDGGYCL